MPYITGQEGVCYVNAEKSTDINQGSVYRQANSYF